MKNKPHPKRWKIALLTWIAIYPTITILLAVMNNILDKIDLMPIRTLILTLIVVPFMVYLIVPFLQKRFAKWLES